MTSNFQKVAEFHQAFDQPAPKELQSDITSRDRRLCDFRISLIEEEFNELMEVYESHYRPLSNNPAVVDAWQTYQMLLRLTAK